MSALLPYPTPVLPFTPASDHTTKRGFFVEMSSANVEIVNSATADLPIGVIADGQPTTGKDSIVIQGSGSIAMVKCAASAGTINPGTFLVLDGTTLGAVKADPGTGARVRVARALESGANDALIAAVLTEPAVLS